MSGAIDPELSLPERPDLSAADPSERHRLVAARFGEVAGSARSWDAPSPVEGWAAADVVAHLLEWFPGFLAAGGVALPDEQPAGDDLAGAWTVRAASVQALLDDPDLSRAELAHPMAGTHVVADAVDRFYTADVFMHTWDLARALGADDRLDPRYADELRLGMEPIEDVLRASGQYGPRVEVGPDADATDRLMAFVGRDPRWRPPGRP